MSTWYHDEEWREAKEDYDMGLAEHHVMMEEARLEHEAREAPDVGPMTTAEFVESLRGTNTNIDWTN